ncbi:hypothetical protein HYW40_02375, partial [Candidatus Curtissbacteria bacterium]|nr:hypothetical protein [Candidatus Curtissbacteria bacterium]
ASGGNNQQAAVDPLAMSDDQLDAEIARLEAEQNNNQQSLVTSQQSISKDPNQMTDEELDEEIARLETQQSGHQVIRSSGDQVTTPDNPMARQPGNQPLRVSKIGRNDPCPCGAVNSQTGKPYKYKKCGMINAPYHKG